MRKIGANYIFTGIKERPWIKNGYVTFEESGTVLDLSEDYAAEKEPAGLEFYSGYLIPGLVNAHLHLELSYLKDISKHKYNGLNDFVRFMAETNKSASEKEIIEKAKRHDDYMWKRGVVVAGDIANTDTTVKVKKASKIEYTTFVEVYGLNPENAGAKINEAVRIKNEFLENGLKAHISAHSTYSLSHNLFCELEKIIKNEDLTSVHYLEGRDEKKLFTEKETEFERILEKIYPALPFHRWNTPEDFAKGLFDKSQKILFVHNLFATHDIVKEITGHFKDAYFVLCPSSNLRVEGKLPGPETFYGVEDKLLIGTDSLVTTHSLDVVKEINLLINNGFSLNTVLTAATVNGAVAFGVEKKYGSFEKGKMPGLVLLEKNGNEFEFVKKVL